MADVPLKEYLESQINWVDRHFAAQITAIGEKTALARDQIDKRLEGMNEFRDTLRDQAGRLATKDELAGVKEPLDARVKALEMNKANFDGKVAIISVVVAIFVSVMVSVIAAFVR